MKASEAYGILPRYLQLRVEHLRDTFREYLKPMAWQEVFRSICECDFATGLPGGFYAAHGTTAEQVSRALADDFNESLPGCGWCDKMATTARGDLHLCGYCASGHDDMEAEAALTRAGIFI